MAITAIIKRVTPWKVRLLSRKVKRIFQERREARMSCQELFTRVYLEGEWGGGSGEFYSGPGSSPEASKPYTDAVRAFIAKQGIRSVIDVGCGDFRVGRVIASSGARYIGVDIVEPLIAHNQREYGGDSVKFVVGNVIEDDLPDADLCLLREVLQHLSNEEILQSLARLRKYRNVIVTDHQPQPESNFVANRDKPHGRDIRLYAQSFIALDQSPFNVQDTELFLDVRSPNVIYDVDERLRSFLIRNGETWSGDVVSDA
jgi:SAM-dependent methyltransferase